MVIDLRKLAKFCLYAAVFSVIIVMSSTFFPFIGGKYYFFRFCIELALALTILWWAFEAPPGSLEKRLEHVFSQPLFIAVSLFVLAVLLASIFAYDPHGAFWSNYERGEGGFQMLHYYMFFVLLLTLFEEEKDWQRLFALSLVAAVILIVYGIMAANFVDNFIGGYTDVNGQPFGTTLWGNLFAPQTRFQGSLGNPAYVAPYLMFCMFYALWRWVSLKKEKLWDGWYVAMIAFLPMTFYENTAKWHILLAVSIVVIALLVVWQRRFRQKAILRGAWYTSLILYFLVFFFLSQTRGTLLGLLAAITVFFLYLIFLYRPWRKIGLIVLATLIIVGGVLHHYKDAPAIQRLPGARLLDMDVTQVTAQTRIWTWGSAWHGFLERPIFGWGPENFSTVFDRYFDIRHYSPGQPSETWFDRAHSIIFDYLAETGICGFLGFFGTFGVFFWQFYKMRKKRGSTSLIEPATSGHRAATSVLVHERHVPILDALLISIPVGYLVQGLVLFDVLPIYMNVFLFLSFAAGLFMRQNKTA
ncbi:MAG TPA: O-antigen ligase family protein [Candidatus Paceibacterota bacterium]|nr:O-antigen ligase family protein [Candidatus Paceibacterota bacterium]